MDLFAHGRRTRIRLRPAWKRAALHLAPWLVLIAIVYFANLVGLLPHSPDAVIPPDSRVVATPRYLRVVVLVALLVLAYVYAARWSGGSSGARHRRPRDHLRLAPASC